MSLLGAKRIPNPLDRENVSFLARLLGWRAIFYRRVNVRSHRTAMIPLVFHIKNAVGSFEFGFHSWT